MAEDARSVFGEICGYTSFPAIRWVGIRTPEIGTATGCSPRAPRYPARVNHAVWLSYGVMDDFSPCHGVVIVLLARPDRVMSAPDDEAERNVRLL